MEKGETESAESKKDSPEEVEVAPTQMSVKKNEVTVGTSTTTNVMTETSSMAMDVEMTASWNPAMTVSAEAPYKSQTDSRFEVTISMMDGIPETTVTSSAVMDVTIPAKPSQDTAVLVEITMKVISALKNVVMGLM